MTSSLWNDSSLRKLFLSKTPLIDVRAPVEFNAGAIPHSVNLPIMNDQERALVGTCYKEQGQAAAIELGHSLVNGKVKEERIQKWAEYISHHPDAQLFCFRGGLRSQISCQWLRASGIERYPIEGGYKRLRSFFLSWLEEAPLPNIIRLGGPTGSGKSLVLQNFRNIDLEALANHRGSAFGDQGEQPSQITFENELALKILENHDSLCLVEDESAMIGKVSLTKRIFTHLRHAPLVILKVEREERIRNIFQQYVQNTDQEFFLSALSRIQKKLGGLRYKEVEEAMIYAFEQRGSYEAHAAWIAMLLDWYYDPLYAKDLTRQPGKILFEGNESEVKEFLKASAL
jgi:tRNA 2-selenouridine synthase